MRIMKAVSLAASVLLVGCGPPAEDPAQNERDFEAMLALDAAYVDGWLLEDPEASVMALFADDAVVIPHHGDDQLIGADNIRSWWFGGPPGVVELFEHERLGYSIGRDRGVTHGRFRLAFRGTADGPLYRNEGNYLLVGRKSDDGWKISHFIWNDPVAQVEPQEKSND